MQIKSILLVSDADPGQRAALAQASLLAKSEDSHLTIASVLESAPPPIPFPAAGAAIQPDVDKAMVQERTEALEEIAGPLRSEGVPVDTRILRGTPFLEIIREILRNGHDIVITGAEGKGGLKGALFGSTSQHLVRKCPVPALLVKPSLRGPLKRVMAAVDPAPDDSTKNSLNARIMEAACWFARLHQSELHVAHAWALHGESILRSPRWATPEDVLAKMLQEAEQRHKKQLEELVKPFATDLPLQTHLVKGLAGQMIPDLVRKEKIDLLIMGAVSRSGIKGLLIGSTAERILGAVNCSLLTMKPEGFVTPVTLND